MEIAFAARVGAWLFGSKVGRVVLIALAAAVGLSAWTWHVRKEARAQFLAQELAKTKAESERRLAAIDAARKNAERAADQVASLAADNSKLLEEIAHASAQNDARACLDAPALERLRRIRGDRQPAGARAPIPPRRPAL
jgi:hypothetical protein